MPRPKFVFSGTALLRGLPRDTHRTYFLTLKLVCMSFSTNRFSRKALLLVTAVFSASLLWAQATGISGRVLDETGAPVIGATVMVKGTVLASGPTDTTFTAENLELAFSGVLRHVTLNGSEESIITDDERPFVAHRPSAVQREER